MSEQTGIAWTRSSWSPWWGCTEVSPGCDHCYARALDNRHRFGGATHWGTGVPRYRTSAANWKQPLRWNRKASGERWTVFPSMCDPFDNEVPEQWLADFFHLIIATPNLVWLLLTKRIGNADKMLRGWRPAILPNVWLGVSVVNQDEADRDIPKLLATPAAKRFVSYEPALAAVDFKLDHLRRYAIDGEGVKRIDWLIVGGESSQGGAKARPFDVAWARSTVAQCRAARTACFVKQLGSMFHDTENGIAGAGWRTDTHHMSLIRERSISEPTYLRERAGSDPSEWPAGLRVQEIPQ